MLLFVHIPKAAGTTLTPLLDQHFAAAEICPAQVWRDLLRLDRAELTRYRFFRGHFQPAVLEHLLPGAPACITMLREPAALLFSTYQYICREPATRLHDLVRSRGLSFAQFLDEPVVRERFTNRLVRFLGGRCDGPPPSADEFAARGIDDIDLRMEMQLARGDDDRALARALMLLEASPFFGLVERFDDSMLLLAHGFAWHPARRVQKLLVSPPDAAGDLNNEATTATIRDMSALDVQLHERAAWLFQRRFDAMIRSLDLDEGAPRDAIIARLDERAAARVGDANNNARSELSFTFDQPIEGAGWHRRERSSLDDSFFCWTGPAREATLDLALPAEDDVVLTIRLIHAMAADIYDSFGVRANGATLQMDCVFEESSVRLHQGIIPHHVIEGANGLLQLTFIVSRTVSPREIDPALDDDRLVGVAVNAIDVRPTAAGAAEAAVVALGREYHAAASPAACLRR